MITEVTLTQVRNKQYYYMDIGMEIDKEGNRRKEQKIGRGKYTS
jgi:hypothetical protein